MKQNMKPDVALVRWALDHFEEWEILCGLRTASAERNWEILELVRRDGLEELTQLMASRIYGMALAKLEKTEPDRIVGASDACKESVKNGAIPL